MELMEKKAFWLVHARPTTMDPVCSQEPECVLCFRTSSFDNKIGWTSSQVPLIQVIRHGVEDGSSSCCSLLIVLSEQMMFFKKERKDNPTEEPATVRPSTISVGKCRLSPSSKDCTVGKNSIWRSAETDNEGRDATTRSRSRSRSRDRSGRRSRSNSCWRESTNYISWKNSAILMLNNSKREKFSEDGSKLVFQQFHRRWRCIVECRRDDRWSWFTETKF